MKQKRIRFALEQDNGYPPAENEYLWCTELGASRYMVDNIPFYAREISLGDEIRVRKNHEEIEFISVIRESENSTVRVFNRRADLKFLVKTLSDLGCDVEQGSFPELLAVSFPKSAKVSKILQFLDEQSEQGSLAFEESSVRYQ